MLSTRSARLAAALLLALLVGWAVRAQRLRHGAPATALPAVSTGTEASDKSAKNSFPDE